MNNFCPCTKDGDKNSAQKQNEWDPELLNHQIKLVIYLKVKLNGNC